MTAISKVVAHYKTSLAQKMLATDMVMTLVDANDEAGNPLSGLFAFTIDAGTASIETVLGTISAGVVTISLRGVNPQNPTVGVPALAREHTRGAQVRVTDYTILGDLKRALNGEASLPNKIFYETHPSFSDDKDIVDKKYVDDQQAATLAAAEAYTDEAIANAGGSGGGSVGGKPMTFSITPASPNSSVLPQRMGYIDKEAQVYSSGTTLTVQDAKGNTQSRTITSDWATADIVQEGHVIIGLYVYVLLVDTGTGAQKMFRYQLIDLSLGGVEMTVVGQAFATTAGFTMTSNGKDIFFSNQAGGSSSKNIVSKYSISGTTITFVGNTTCGSTSAIFSAFAVDSSENYIGTDNGIIYVYDSAGSLTYTSGQTFTTLRGLLNWTNTIYGNSSALGATSSLYTKLYIPDTDTIGLGTTVSGDAREDLVKGDRVGIANISGGFSKAVPAGYYADSDFGVASVGSHKNIEVAPGTIVTLYENNGDGSLKAVAISVDKDDMENALSFGTPVSISALMVAAAQTNGFDICKLDTNKFLVTYTALNTYDVRTVVGTVSGNTITLGTPQIAATCGASGSLGFSLMQIATDKAVLAYYQNASGGSSNVLALTVASTTATFGTPVLTDAGLNAAIIKGCKINTDKFAIVADQSSQVGTISGVTITLGSVAAIFTTTAASSKLENDIMSTANDAYVVISRLSGGGISTLLQYCTVSGTTITSGTELTYPSNIYNLYFVSSTLFYVFGAPDGGATGFISFTINSGNVVLRKTEAAKIGSFGAYGNIPSLDGDFFIGSINTTTFLYFIEGMSNNFMGLVQTNSLRDKNVIVLYSGVDSNQSDLATGAHYVVGDGGTLVFKNSNASPVGMSQTVRLIAQSPTELLIQ